MGTRAGEKLERLNALLGSMESALLAYSGGVDSSLLLHISRDALGDRLLAVTVDTEFFNEQEIRDARSYAETLGVPHRVIKIKMLDRTPFLHNPRDRCYGCKTIIFTHLVRLAGEQGFSSVIEGSNSDDDTVYRPGRRALEELSVRSPLKEVGLVKDEIRQLAKEKGVPSWDKPSRPCLATRFPYGTGITIEDLERVKHAEEYLTAMGLREFRVRAHGTLARIEAGRQETARLGDPQTADSIVREFKKLGYRYIALDLEGFRSGSMDEDQQ